MSIQYGPYKAYRYSQSKSNELFKYDLNYMCISFWCMHFPFKSVFKSEFYIKFVSFAPQLMSVATYFIDTNK
jgi:hypothetical protein